jgi:CDP-diacylglycerol--serine O-phosphatidyltransferase
MARRPLPTGAEGPRAVARRRRLQRGIYLLPSAFTMGNIFLGFWSIILGLRGEFGVAALAIAGAGVLDGVDGRIARLTGTESDFGREFDSLADVVTFGVAPALLAFFWGLHEFPRVGWLVPLFFVVCGATRLARFNVQTKVADKRFFAGLPIPAAAGTVASVLFFDPDREWRTWMAGALLVAMALVAALMVSTVRYRSFKQVDLRRRRSYRAALVLAVVLVLIALDPHVALVVLACTYTASGPLEWMFHRLRGRRGPEPPATDHGHGMTAGAPPPGVAP